MSTENKYQFKGTPAPWRLAAKRYQIQFYYITGKDDDGKRDLAVVKIDYGYHPIKEQLQCTQANAHLIAAAPELLQGCIDALEIVEGLYREGEIGAAYYKEKSEAYKAAIHKALNIQD